MDAPRTYKVIETRIPEPIERRGVICISVQGERSDGSGLRLFWFYYWYRCNVRNTIHLHDVMDATFGVTKAFEFEWREAAPLAEEAARKAFKELLPKVPPAPEKSEWDREREVNRLALRKDEEIKEAVLEELQNTLRYALTDTYTRQKGFYWFSVVLMRDYIAQHRAGGGDFKWQSKKEQTEVIRVILETLVKEGKAERAIGQGKRGGDCIQYKAILPEESNA